MPSAYIETDFAWVRLHSGRLAVFSQRDDDPSDDLLQEIPLEGLESLTLREHVQLTTEALCALLRAGIPVHYVDLKGDVLGSVLTPSPAESATRLRQYQRTLDPAFALAQAAAIVEAKLFNQLRLLQRLQANRPTLDEALWTQMNLLRQQTAQATTLDALRGVEGAAAAFYYPLWARFLPEEFPFEHRSKRPPLNPVNACISYASTLLYHDLLAAVHRAGLDPGLGLLHATDNGRWSLALDLMEPFRPALCDALTTRLFSHRILNATHFEPHEGGVYLTREGRRELIQHYEQRLDRSFLSEQLAHRTTPRQAILQQAVSYKTALADGTAFQPFRLN